MSEEGTIQKTLRCLQETERAGKMLIDENVGLRAKIKKLEEALRNMTFYNCGACEQNREIVEEVLSDKEGE